MTEERFLRGTREVLEVKDMFIILIVVMVSLVDTYVKTYQIVHFAYTSIAPQ